MVWHRSRLTTHRPVRVTRPAFMGDTSMKESNERITAFSDASNPWSKQYWHLTSQARIILLDRAEADRLARAAGHKDWLSARVKNAR